MVGKSILWRGHPRRRSVPQRPKNHFLTKLVVMDLESASKEKRIDAC